MMLDTRLTGPARTLLPAIVTALCSNAGGPAAAESEAPTFEGRFFRGEGDVEYLRLLDEARRMFAPDPEFQNVAMLYTPSWNGLVEGPKWGMWWIQNSYGPSYCSMPFLTEPVVTFLGNSQAAWFDTMGDGKKTWKWRDHEWTVPDGQLCDAATPNGAIPKQGDGRVDIHDWGIEFTAAGTLMQSELLLIGRDPEAVAHDLPRLERCANFIESRHDPKNNLFLAGPAGNLLAPNYAAWKKPDGTYGKAYLAGLSITYIAALDRLIELEKLAGDEKKAALYTKRRDLARKGLALLETDEGYFVKFIDPDGTKHGVYGAAKHGYFEASPNHDAICFRVANDRQARRIYEKIASIPPLRRNTFVISNHPSLDDMYEDGGIFRFGTWINGGHWSTCEARMVMAYYRLGEFEDARRSMQTLLTFARRFQMDNPLKNFGATPWFDANPTNLCYDALGPPAAMVRGLFEYIYRADGLTLLPHVPPGITRLEQRFPIRFGSKRIYLATYGSGPIARVLVNGETWPAFTADSVSLPYEKTPDTAAIQIVLGEGKPKPFAPPKPDPAPARPPAAGAARALIHSLVPPVIVPNELPLRIGADSNGGSRFLGGIARPLVFGRALKPNEIAQLARKKTLTEPADDPTLVGGWNFDDPSGSGFPSVAGGAKAAKAVGIVESLESSVGKALRLNGESYLEVPHSPALDLREAVTLAAWIRPEEPPQGGARILDKTRVGGSDGYLLDTHPDDSLRLLVHGGMLSHDAKLPPGEWTHVAGTVGDGKMALYVSGREAATSELRSEAPDLGLADRIAKLRLFYARLVENGLGDTYAAAHARFAADCFDAGLERRRLQEAGQLARLPAMADLEAMQSYVTSAAKLREGLETRIRTYAESTDEREGQVYGIWTSLGDTAETSQPPARMAERANRSARSTVAGVAASRVRQIPSSGGTAGASPRPGRGMSRQ